MISTVAFNTRAEIKPLYAQSNTSTLEGSNSPQESSYTTTPMAAVLPVYQAPCEEELHASFEKAISGRLTTVHHRLAHLHYISYSETGPLAHSTTYPEVFTVPPARASHSRQKIFAFVALAFLFLLAGFDLMGLLVLHMR
ncbi:MAG TPA: hypothetical protein VL485_00845 [Ktedonobacteraceae bacterium]|jgi:hypothetical protein|nr:hypothetical protein [Ktedonobacteraceae bacterium]